MDGRLQPQRAPDLMTYRMTPTNSGHLSGAGAPSHHSASPSRQRADSVISSASSRPEAASHLRTSHQRRQPSPPGHGGLHLTQTARQRARAGCTSYRQLCMPSAAFTLHCLHRAVGCVCYQHLVATAQQSEPPAQTALTLADCESWVRESGLDVRIA